MTGEKRKTSQLSRSIYSEMTNDPTFHKLSRRLEDLRNHSDIFMIVEDASRAFPYSRFDREFRASLRSSSDLGDLPEQVATAIGHEGRFRGRQTYLAEALRDFAELCIQQALLTGVAAYEIVYSDPDAEGRWTRFHLARIHPYRRSFGRHRHYIAGHDDQQGRWITLPGPSVVVFRLEPASYRRAVRDAMSVLRSARAWTAFTRMAEQGVPYDIEAHSNTEQELLAQATRGVGWVGRGLYSKRMLDPYRLTRELEFAIFLARLRSMVVSGVQTALDRAGRVLGFKAGLEVSGLPTEDDIRRAISMIEAGPPPDQSLLDVVKPYLYP